MRVKRSAVTSAVSLGSQLQIGLRAELQGHQFLRPQPDAVGDVVLGDNEVVAQIIVAADGRKSKAASRVMCTRLWLMRPACKP
jgi:hypothetical protein